MLNVTLMGTVFVSFFLNCLEMFVYHGIIVQLFILALFVLSCDIQNGAEVIWHYSQTIDVSWVRRQSVGILYLACRDQTVQNQTPSPANIFYATLSTLEYSRLTSTKSPLICMTTFSVNFTKIRFLMPQSHDRSCCPKHTNTGISSALTAGTHWSMRTRLRAFSRRGKTAKFASVSCPSSWRLCGENPAIYTLVFILLRYFTYNWNFFWFNTDPSTLFLFA
jgi:hypothetical protein